MKAVWRLIAHHEDAAGVIAQIRRTGIIWMGWGEIGDLRQANYVSGSHIGRTLSKISPERTNSGFGGASLWRFYNDIQIGDLVIVSSKQGRQVTVQVTGPYQYSQASPLPPLTEGYRHCRSVNITNIDPHELFTIAGGMANGENVRWTIFRCSNSVVV